MCKTLIWFDSLLSLLHCGCLEQCGSWKGHKTNTAHQQYAARYNDQDLSFIGVAAVIEMFSTLAWSVFVGMNHACNDLKGQTCTLFRG